MPWNVFIFPLVAGYYFLSTCKRYKYINQRLDRQRLIFNSILCGILLFTFSYISLHLAYYAYAKLSFHLVFFDRLGSHFKYEYLDASLLSLFLSWFLAQIINTRLDDTTELYTTIKKVGTDLERIIAKSYLDFELIQFTLTNNKFYIGIATEIPPPGSLAYLSIKPFYSGYRSEDTKRLVFTNNYSNAYESYLDNDPENDMSMTVIIKSEDVTTATPFDLGIYTHFNSKSIKKMTSEKHDNKS
ncbi:hypothetical protein FNH22_01135 [Fulvivirga sp. M361]|uniref:hypothetical protein n=1 Tax=Fulvivirga sp. M361 TaxID=2594266 RepID=UPI001179DEF0|nr:hypothetical protein [Fulvivirga sp. M361]TRX62730.1 hypothetical protein FNH22_01135 [Fulvivirga sp. M361]